MKYNEAKELIQMKTNTVKSFMIDLEHVEVMLEEKVTTVEIFNLMNTVNTVKKEASKNYRRAVEMIKECDDYVYCEDLTKCENNFELEEEIFEQLRNLKEEIVKLNKKIKEIENKTF